MRRFEIEIEHDRPKISDSKIYFDFIKLQTDRESKCDVQSQHESEWACSPQSGF